jgi:hypothetical protein
MEPIKRSRVLIVAHKTATTTPLLAAVRARTGRGPSHFTLLVPNIAKGLHRVVDPEDQPIEEAESVVARALPLLRGAAGGEVASIIGDPNPLDAIADALNVNGFDEVMLSTLPTRVSKWLHLDLPRKVAAMGVPVSTITPQEARIPVGMA